MHKRLVFLLPALLFLILGQTADPKGIQAAGPQKGVNQLEALLLSNSFREGATLAAEVLADPAQGPETRAVCGLAYLKAGRIKEAEVIFNQVLALSPDNPEAHLGLGRLARIRNDADEAIGHLRRAAASRAFYEEALRQLWKAAWDRGQVSDLLEIYKTAERRYLSESKPLPS